MRKSVEVDLIVSQYRTVVGALDNMFKEIGLRSEVELWRVDGVGTCRGLSKISSEYLLVGSAREELLRLREERNLMYSGERSPLTDCPYHRLESGCVLGDLKSPYCISLVDYPAALTKSLRINGYVLSLDIKDILEIVWTQKQKLADEFLPEFRIPVSDFAQVAAEAVKEMTSYVKKHHVLDASDRKFLQSCRSSINTHELVKCSFLIGAMNEFSAHSFYDDTHGYVPKGQDLVSLAWRQFKG